MSLSTEIFFILFTFLSSFVGAGMLTVAPNFLPDVPNLRSMHSRPTPRGGGIAFAGAFILTVCAALFFEPEALSGPILSLLAGAVLLTGLGLLDDAYSLPASARLGIEALVVAGLSIYAGADRWDLFGVIWIEGWPVFVLQTLWLLTAINFFNFMDGLDGFAASMATVIALALSLGLFYDAARLPGDGPGIQSATIYEVFAFAYLALAFALAGFLVWNLPPARIFMGDAGSYFLGFALAYPALLFPYSTEYPNQAQHVALRLDARAPALVDSFSVMILWLPFLMDPALTLLRRLVRGDNIVQAHRTHIYQLLSRLGWRPLRVAGFYLGVFTLCIACLGVRAAGAPEWRLLLTVAGLAVAGGVLHWRYGARLSERLDAIPR
jgi:Fuc2NAc and GlcNAc transferase